MSELTVDFDYRKRAYHEAASKLEIAVYALLVERLLAAFPRAVSALIEGAFNEDGEMRLNIGEVHLDEAAGRLSVEDGNDEVSDFSAAQDELLMYLADLTGDDYLHDTRIDLVTGGVEHGFDRASVGEAASAPRTFKVTASFYVEADSAEAAEAAVGAEVNGSTVQRYIAESVGDADVHAGETIPWDMNG